MFSFGSSVPTPVSQAAPTTGFSFGLSQGAQPAATAPSFSFGPATQATMSQATSGLMLGSTAPLTAPISLSLSSAPTTTATGLTAARDLGGEGATGGGSSNASKDPKDQPLPPELVAIVESFKNSLKEQKTIRDENNQPRFAMQSIVEISNELEDNLRVKLAKLDVVLRKNKKTIEVLKKETSNLVSDAETANRSVKAQGLDSTSSPYPFTPSRYVPSSNQRYFTKLVDQYEKQMSLYSKQIDELSRHLENMNKVVSPSELLTVVRRQHEALIALAAEIYAVHEHIGRYSDDTHVSAPVPHATIAIRHEGEDSPSKTERQTTKPISFPTFVRQEKTTATPIAKPDAVTTNRFPEAASLSSPSSIAAQGLSPGNMSLGSPIHSPTSNQQLNQSLTSNQPSFLF